MAQDSRPITISGKVTDPYGHDCIYQVVVVNERTSEGTLASAGGVFTASARHSDTILFSASGFAVKKICFNDSAYKTAYKITVKLDSLHFNLAEVKVYPVKSLREIDEDKNRLGTYKAKSSNPEASIMNPISLLYERFSKLEKSKREVARLTDEQQKRDILKDIFHLYIKNDIMNLDDTQFDAFIDYLNFSDNFVKNSTDYELLTAIKYKYDQYEKDNSYYQPRNSH
jgi:hypothetical protein